MVVENLKSYVVPNYKALFKLYKNGDLGKVEQRLPDNLQKLKAGVDGTDIQLIISLLNADKDNVWHVAKVEGGFRVTIIGFNIDIEILPEREKFERICIQFGEDGLWKEVKYPNDEQYQDAFGEIEFDIYSVDADLLKQHVEVVK